MAEYGRFSPQLLFLDSARHSILASIVVPTGSLPRHGIVVCPAFGEEMNRTRRTIRLLMEQASRLGTGSINVDLRGTGDSDGDFADARWEDWLADLARACDWLRQQDCPEISLLGIRAGALLAWELAGSADWRFNRILFWQPVLAGRAVVTDLLRARVIASAPGGSRESVTTLREQLQDGRPVEASGYVLSSQLARSLDQARIEPAGGRRYPPLGWLEIVADPDGAVRPVAEQAAASLREAGLEVDLRRVQDPPFWATTETTTGYATVEASLRWLSGGG